MAYEKGILDEAEK